MEKSPQNPLLTKKSLAIGLGLLLLGSLFFLVLNTSQENQPVPTGAPTPTISDYPHATEEVIEPDKQVEGQIIVQFKEQYTDAQINERLKIYNAEIISEIGGINQKVLRVPKGQENAIIEKMRNDPYVESAEGDYENHIMFVPNDPLFVNQYGLKNTGQAIKSIAGTAGADVKADVAWDTVRGNGIKVAVLDTGIAPDHPDFAGKIVAQKSFTTATINDMAGHGTHVAGTITTATNNGVGIAGTCPDCQLIVGKVMGDDGKGTTSNIASGITWAADQGAKVINMSLGTTAASSATTYQTAVDYAISKGAVVVASAGNCGGTNFAANGCTSQNQTSYPGASNGVITVAATDNKDAKASFSNYGSYVEVTAPGSNIFSTGPNYTFPKAPSGYSTSSPYFYNSGTSMSSPMVAGVVALIWSSQYGTSAQNVINRLYATVDKIPGTGTNWTQGRVNAAKAVGAPAATATAAPTPSNVSPTFVCAGSASGNVCPPTPTNQTGTTIAPTTSGSNGTPQPTSQEPTTTVPSGTQPTSSAPTTTPTGSNPFPGTGQPCTSNQFSFGRNNIREEGSKARVKDESSVQSFFEFFFELLFRFIMLFLQLIGVGTPCTPGGTPTPTPTTPAATTVPTQAVTTQPTQNPTQGPTATTAPTQTPTQVPTQAPTATTVPNVTLVPPVQNP